MSATSERQLMTAAEVSDVLGVHPVTVRRWSEAGRLKVVKLSPRTFRYTAASVEALIASAREEPTDA